jgi:hypothetical protein
MTLCLSGVNYKIVKNVKYPWNQCTATARQARFYFSIVPPTCSYGSSMFIYAGILLPLQE